MCQPLASLKCMPSRNGLPGSTAAVSETKVTVACAVAIGALSSACAAHANTTAIAAVKHRPLNPLLIAADPPFERSVVAPRKCELGVGGIKSRLGEGSGVRFDRPAAFFADVHTARGGVYSAA